MISHVGVKSNTSKRLENQEWRFELTKVFPGFFSRFKIKNICEVGTEFIVMNVRILDDLCVHWSGIYRMFFLSKALDYAMTLYSFIMGVPNLSYFASGLGLRVLWCSWVDCTGKLTFAPCFLHSSTAWLLLSPCSSFFFTSSLRQRWNRPLTKVSIFIFIWWPVSSVYLQSISRLEFLNTCVHLRQVWNHVFSCHVHQHIVLFYLLGNVDAFFAVWCLVMPSFPFPVYLF